MRCIAAFILIAFGISDHAEEFAAYQINDVQGHVAKLVDILVNKLDSKLFDWARDTSLRHATDLNDETIAKTHLVRTRNALDHSPKLASSGLDFSASSELRVKPISKPITPGLPRKKSPETQVEEAARAKVILPEVVAAKDGRTEADEQLFGLMVASNEALSRRNFLSAFAFAAAAAATLDANKEANAADAISTASAVGSGVDWNAIFQKSASKALGGGKAGASAAVVQVVSLMWLRTAMNYQYRYGGDLGSALKTLTKEGGIPRLYQGLPFALVQGPLSRFGDTATNVGILALFDAIPEAAGIPQPVRTAAASLSAGLFRILCMPVDTAKTALQVEGAKGLDELKKRILAQGPAPLFQGSIATAVATVAGNYPWFLTYNTLDGALPPVSKDELVLSLLRSALLGLSASCVSDTVSNSLRVVKTTQQTAALGGGNQTTTGGISIAEALKIVLDTDGIKGLFGRGLKTRLLTNAIQGGLFSVLWKYFQQTGVR